MNVHNIINELENRRSANIKKYGVFFAFSNSQLEEGMKENPIPEGEKYTRLFGGTYCASSKAKEFLSAMSADLDWFKEAINNGHREEYISYQLSNHEAYYTGDWTDAFERLASEIDATEDEVAKVYFANLKNQEA